MEKAVVFDSFFIIELVAVSISLLFLCLYWLYRLTLYHQGVVQYSVMDLQVRFAAFVYFSPLVISLAFLTNAAIGLYLIYIRPAAFAAVDFVVRALFCFYFTLVFIHFGSVCYLYSYGVFVIADERSAVRSIYREYQVDDIRLVIALVCYVLMFVPLVIAAWPLLLLRWRRVNARNAGRCG